jgi:hypothetical protein
MAEVLIKAVDAAHADPVKDARCYKRGDPVVVQPDGFAWGRLELLPPADGGAFVRVRINGIAPEQVRQFMRNRWGISLEDGEVETVSGEPRIARRRAIRVLVDSLPAGVRQQLWQTGFYAATWQQIRNFVQHKLLEETA